MRYFLTRLQIEGFRGVNNAGNPLDLKFKADSVCSVFGQNGLGKTSIFDAITYAIRGTVRRLDDMHPAEQGDHCYNNFFHPEKTATIKLTLRPDDGSPDVVVKVTRTADGVRNVDSPTGHPTPAELLRSLDNPFVLLDLRSFLSFVDDSPLNRGRAMSSLIGLQSLSEFRQILNVLSHQGNLKTDLKVPAFEEKERDAARVIDSMLKQIDIEYAKFFSEEIDQKLPYDASLDGVLRKLGSDPAIREHCQGRAIESLPFAELLTIVQSVERKPERDQLASLATAVDQLSSSALASETDELLPLAAAVKQFDADVALTRGPNFEHLLHAIEKVFASGEWDAERQCPACDTVKDASVRGDIAAKLKQYEQVEASRESVTTFWRQSQIRLWVRRIEEHTAVGIPAEERRLGVFDRVFGDQGSPTLADVEDLARYVAALESTRKEVVEQMIGVASEIKKHLPDSLVRLTAQVTAAEQLVRLESELRKSRISRLAAADEAVRRLQWQEYISRASRIFAQAELELSTRVAESLRKRYEAAYAEIASNPYVVPELKRASGTEELQLRLKTYYSLRDVPAASVLPESYRNALGLAVHLSAASARRETARFIILDDVTSSFDAGHQFRLMDFIRGTFSHPSVEDGPQVIILSHDGLLEKYFDKHDQELAWHHQKLRGLPPQGMLLSSHQSGDRLRGIIDGLLDEGNMLLASPLIRQHFESTLLTIIRKLDIAVPIDFSMRDDQKMVGHAIEAIRDAVELHRQANMLVLTRDQQTGFDAAFGSAAVANRLSHFATSSMDSFDVYALKGVMAAIDQLVQCFQYPCSCGNSGGNPRDRYYKTLAVKHCEC